MTAGATILALGGIIIGCIGAYTAYNIKTAEDTIVVTGSAKETVTADAGRLVLNVETKTGTADLQQGYARLEKAASQITSYLDSKGFTDHETPSITSFPDYIYPQNGQPIFNGYTVNRQVIIRSSDVEGLGTLANNIEPFLGTGYSVTTQALELTYSKLDEARVSLLSDAIKDAKARADAIAKDSGRNVGVLKNASSGVVQVLPQGGVEISDYGTYDTQSKVKDIMVTVRATFEL